MLGCDDVQSKLETVPLGLRHRPRTLSTRLDHGARHHDRPAHRRRRSRLVPARWSASGSSRRRSRSCSCAALIQGTTHLCQGQEAVSVGRHRGHAAGRRPDQHVPRPRRGAGARHGRPRPPSRSSWVESTGGSGASAARCTSSTLARATSAPTRSSARGCRSRSGRRSAFQMQGKPQRRADVLRRRRDQHRHVPRGPEHGRRLEGAGRVHHHQQPVRRVLARCATTTADRTTSPAAPSRTGCPGIIVDGQDVDVVHAATSRGASSAPAPATGPSLLEMKTYRYRGHSRVATRRSTGRTASWMRWKARDPIEHPRRPARRRGPPGRRRPGDRSGPRPRPRSTPPAERAAAAPYPTLEETRQYVYAD